MWNSLCEEIIIYFCINFRCNNFSVCKAQVISLRGNNCCDIGQIKFYDFCSSIRIASRALHNEALMMKLIYFFSHVHIICLPPASPHSHTYLAGSIKIVRWWVSLVLWPRWWVHIWKVINSLNCYSFIARKSRANAVAHYFFANCQSEGQQARSLSDPIFISAHHPLIKLE